MPIFQKRTLNVKIDIMKAVLLCAAIIVVPFGIGGALFEHTFWYGQVMLDLLLWVLLCCGVGGILALCRVPGKVPLLTGFLLLYLAFGIGLGQSAAVLYFAASAYCLGRLILYAGFRTERARLMLTESLVLGTGTYAAVFGVLIHYPLNYLPIYVALLALPILLACLLKLPSFYRPRARLAWSTLCRKSNEIGYVWVLLAVIVIGFSARYAFFPTLNYDDNATHLRMWTLLSGNHIYDFDVRAQIWVVAPFFVDLLHAVISLIAQSDARAAMNLALTAFLLYCMWKLSRFVNRRLDQRLLLIILFATTPILASLLTGLQTELMLAVLATAGALLVLEQREGLVSARGAVMLMIAALCAATKLPGAVLGITLLAMLLLERFLQRKQGLPAPAKTQWVAWLLVLLIASFVAFHSYAFAWYKTGNPLFPLYNGYFKSPFFGQYNFIDTRYAPGFSFKSYWGLFFNTTRHYESLNFVAGFQYLLLLPLAIVMLLLFGRSRSATRMLLPLCGFGVTMFAAVQYWRYLFPILPLASVLIGALFYRGHRGIGKILLRRITTATLLVFAAINMYFFPGISWYFDHPAGKMYRPDQREELLTEHMPEQFFNAQINRDAPQAGVLYERDRPFGATLLASPTYTNWYAPATLEQIDAIRSPQDMLAFLRQHKINYVFWRFGEAINDDDIYRTLLRRHLNQFGEPLAVKSGVVMYRLHETPLAYREILHIRNFSAYAEMAPPRGSSVSASGQFLVGSTPLALKEFDTGMASAARYSARLSCPVKGGSFIAQINWNVGAPYYRLISCNHDDVEVDETVPLPVGASHGTLIVTSRDAGPLTLHEISVSLN